MAKVLIGNVKGPKGDPGDQGIQGVQGIPGEVGVRGSKWYTGTAITGISTTGTVFATGLSGVLEEDFYINKDTGNYYRCTVGGDEDVAEWIFVGNLAAVVDATLAIEGLPADAKATGDALAKKPENVSELFNFNTYNGDINTLAVGMYMYYNGNTYSGNGGSVGGGGAGWTIITSIDRGTGFCTVKTNTLFGQGAGFSGDEIWVKPNTNCIIISKREAEYIAQLVSVWGVYNGGARPKYFPTFESYRDGESFSLGAEQACLMFRYMKGPSVFQVYAAYTFQDGSSGYVINVLDPKVYTDLPTKSGSTITLTPDTGLLGYWKVLFF